MVTPGWCRSLPKVELHVHFEGSVRPETLLRLAKRHSMPLPAETVEGLQEWYTFRDFRHFVDVYVAVTQRIKTAEDLETCGREFVDGQVAQNVLHSEVTYTASTIATYNGICWKDQLSALMSTCAYAREQGVGVQFILDIVRGRSEEEAQECVDWVLEGREAGVVCALGLAGEEWRGTRPYAQAVRRAEREGVPFIPHAGETCGPDVIRECFQVGHPPRIGHGVRCVEDPDLMEELRDRGTVLEVCPTSNVALGVVPELAAHQLPALIEAGIAVTLNSDDPPMFGTSLSEELLRCSEAFGLAQADLCAAQVTAARAACLPGQAREDLVRRLSAVGCA
jgi:adenosine deaminase